MAALENGDAVYPTRATVESADPDPIYPKVS